MLTFKWLWHTFLIAIGLRLDTHAVETEAIDDSRVKITVKNERTGEETENTALIFEREKVDRFRRLEA